MNEIQTWQQGRYAPEDRTNTTPEQAAQHEADEKHLVRPGLRENAICRCARPDDAAWLAKRLNFASHLEQMTYDFATGKTDGSEIVALVRKNVDA